MNRDIEETRLYAELRSRAERAAKIAGECIERNDRRSQQKFWRCFAGFVVAATLVLAIVIAFGGGYAAQ